VVIHHRDFKVLSPPEPGQICKVPHSSNILGFDGCSIKQISFGVVKTKLKTRFIILIKYTLHSQFLKSKMLPHNQFSLCGRYS
jgi:hypothetical protein